MADTIDVVPALHDLNAKLLLSNKEGGFVVAAASEYESRTDAVMAGSFRLV